MCCLFETACHPSSCVTFLFLLLCIFYFFSQGNHRETCLMYRVSLQKSRILILSLSPQYSRVYWRVFFWYRLRFMYIRSRYLSFCLFYPGSGAIVPFLLVLHCYDTLTDVYAAPVYLSLACRVARLLVHLFRRTHAMVLFAVQKRDMTYIERGNSLPPRRATCSSFCGRLQR